MGRNPNGMQDSINSLRHEKRSIAPFRTSQIDLERELGKIEDEIRALAQNVPFSSHLVMRSPLQRRC